MKFPLGFVPHHVRVRPEERDAEGNMVVHRLSPEEAAVEALPEEGLTASVEAALGLVSHAPLEASPEQEAIEEAEAAAELAALRSELVRG
jgi:hypothetical protein